MPSAVIASLGTQSGNQPRIRELPEKSAQTFLMGVPVQWDIAAGGIKEWDGVTIAAGIAGISKIPASNLSATGVRQFQTLNNSPIPNQPLAQPIVRGAPFNNGNILFELADEDILFFAQVGPAQVVGIADLLGQFGMTKDGDGHWFVDKNKVGAQAVCQVVRLDPIDTVRGVQIAFLPAVQQVVL